MRETVERGLLEGGSAGVIWREAIRSAVIVCAQGGLTGRTGVSPVPWTVRARPMQRARRPLSQCAARMAAFPVSACGAGGRGATALPSGSAGRLAPPEDDGHAGRVTLPQRTRRPFLVRRRDGGSPYGHSGARPSQQAATRENLLPHGPRAERGGVKCYLVLYAVKRIWYNTAQQRRNLL